jgi:hypothetical protein
MDFTDYEEHMEFLKKLAEYKKEKNLDLTVVLETTRGCPFSCVFCEWGGGIGGKVIKKPMDIIKKDIVAIAKSGFEGAEIADANFGMYKERDLEWFGFLLENGLVPQSLSVVKLKNLEKKKELLKDMYEVILKFSKKTKNDYKAVMAVGTAHQSVSDVATKIASRVDLTFKEKTELSKYIGELLGEGNRLDTLDLIMAMPGSTLDDFYEEFNLLWYTKANMPRYQYLFLPDTSSTDPEYLKKYNIELLEVKGTFYNNEYIPKDSIYASNSFIYHTIASSYSFTKEEAKQMWIMNTFGFICLHDFYSEFECKISAKEFAKICWGVLQELLGFDEVMDYANRLFENNGNPLNPQYINDQHLVSYADIFIAKKQRLIRVKLERMIN